MEAGLLRQLRLRIRRDAVRDRSAEALLGGIDAHVHLRGVPGVGRVDVVGAGAREADEVGRGAQQHVVARARPRLVDDVLVVRVEGGVEEEVDRRPALARLDRVRLELRVEVVGAVDVAEVAHVLVVLRGAGEAEGVVAADRVADDLDERLEVVVEELGVEAGRRVGVAHQRARRRRVEAALLAFLQLRGAEGEEVGALAAAHVDHLDVLAGLHLVGERRGAVDLEVEARVGERIGEDGLALVARRRRARDLELEVGGGHAALDDRQRRRARRPGRRPRGRRGTSPPRPAAMSGPKSSTSASGPASPTTSARWPPCRSRIVSRSSGRRETVVVPPGRTRYVSRPGSRGTRPGTSRRGRRATAIAHAFAGSLASASAASARSCSASSRFAVESSFLTSFSTARRL